MFGWFKKKKVVTIAEHNLVSIGGRLIVPDDINEKVCCFAIEFSEPVSFSRFANAALKLSNKDVIIRKFDDNNVLSGGHI